MFSCLYIPQGHYFIITLWQWNTDQYDVVVFQQIPSLQIYTLCLNFEHVKKMIIMEDFLLTYQLEGYKCVAECDDVALENYACNVYPRLYHSIFYLPTQRLAASSCSIGSDGAGWSALRTSHFYVALRGPFPRACRYFCYSPRSLRYDLYCCLTSRDTFVE